MKLSVEIAATTAVGIAAFGLIFGQSPMPEQTRLSKTDKSHLQVQQASEQSNQVVAVLHTASASKAAPLGSVELQVPDLTVQTTDELVQVTATSLKMRTGPSSEDSMVKVYAHGTVFQKIDKQGGWLQVRNAEDGTSGWMSAEFLQTTN